MSTTVGQLVDRTFREYLEPTDNVESFSILSGSMTDSVTELSFDGNYFTQEEEDALDAGTIIEVGTELMKITSVGVGTTSPTEKPAVVKAVPSILIYCPDGFAIILVTLDLIH